MEENWPVPADELEKPKAVEKAEATIRHLGIGLGVAGGLGSAWYWFASIEVGYQFIPIFWWGIFLAALVTIYFLPPMRHARVAREIIRRWDELRVQMSLEIAGAPTDPRLRVAEEMAKRILNHPGIDESVARVTSELVGHLHVTQRDLRTVQLLQEASQAGGNRGAGTRGLSDVIDFLEARTGQLISGLSDLHGAVILRDAEALGRVKREVENVVHELSAQQEVERLLGRREP